MNITYFSVEVNLTKSVKKMSLSYFTKIRVFMSENLNVNGALQGDYAASEIT